MDLGGPVKPQDTAGVFNFSPLRCGTVAIEDTDLWVLTQVIKRSALRPLPKSQMIIIQHDHAAFWAHAGAVFAYGCQQANAIVLMGIEDQIFNMLTKGHG